MKLKELADQFRLDLTSLYEENEATAMFFLAIEHYLNCSRASYSLKKENELSTEELHILQSTIHELRTGKPIQYVIGETHFYDLKFKVTEAVLIPRPETEELVEWVLEKVKRIDHQSLSLLDLGTGSGCIAISLKKNLPNASVSALDISSKALRIAQENALLNETEVVFFEADIINGINSIPASSYSVMISNPPYITLDEKAQMHPNVLANEPHLALFVSNEEPLIFYKAIADFAQMHLKEEGLLFFEINEYLGKEMVEMLKAKGFINIELKRDMQGKDRMICCRK